MLHSGTEMNYHEDVWQHGSGGRSPDTVVTWVASSGDQNGSESACASSEYQVKEQQCVEQATPHHNNLERQHREPPTAAQIAIQQQRLGRIAPSREVAEHMSAWRVTQGHLVTERQCFGRITLGHMGPQRETLFADSPESKPPCGAVSVAQESTAILCQKDTEEIKPPPSFSARDDGGPRMKPESFLRVFHTTLVDQSSSSQHLSSDHVFQSFDSSLSDVSMVPPGAICGEVGPISVPALRSHSTPLTLRWLSDNYELRDGVCIPRSVIYQHYTICCYENDMAPVNAASFGKIVRQQYPSLTTRRLGTRGKSRYHYYGLAVSNGSRFYQPIYSKQHARWAPRLHITQA